MTITTIAYFLFAVILFATAAYGLYWVAEKFKMPPPVFWIVGGILIVIILLFIAGQTGVSNRPLFPSHP